MKRHSFFEIYFFLCDIPGVYFPKIWVGVCGALLETLTLFQTKICDFSYPISDLTSILTPHFRPAPNPIPFA